MTYNIPYFKGLTSSQITATIKRFVKPESYKGNSKRERSAFTKLFGLYPDPQFWLKWDLGFQLNSLYWLVGPEGKDKIDIGFKMFHLNLDVPSAPKAPLDDSSLDNLFQVKHDEVVADDPAPEATKPKQMTIADFLS